MSGRPYLLAILLLSATTSRADSAPVHFDCHLVSDQGRGAFGVATGDWNEDGKVDLAVSYSEGGLTAFLAQPNGQWQPQPIVTIGPVNRGIAVGDIDRDGHLDLVVAHASSWAVSILKGDGHGSFKLTVGLYSGMSPFHPYLVQLDNDPRLDLVVANETNMPAPSAPGTVSVFRNVSIDEKRNPTMLISGNRPAAVAVAELDERPGLDLGVVNWGAANLSLFRNLGDGNFATQEITNYGGQLPYGVDAADFNRDGKMDVVVTDVALRAVLVLDGDGKGHFAPGRKFETGDGVRHVVTADVNRDGSMDIVAANTGADSLSLLLGHGDGSFASAQQLPVGLTPRVVAARDLNGDGKVDLMATLLTTKEVAVLYQTDGPGIPCPPSHRLEPR